MWLKGLARIVLVLVLLQQCGGGLLVFAMECPAVTGAAETCCDLGCADESPTGQSETSCSCLLCADPAIGSVPVPAVERSVQQFLHQPITWQREAQLLRPRFIPCATPVVVMPRSSPSPLGGAFVSVVILRC